MIIFERVINLKDTTTREFVEILNKMDTSKSVDKSRTLTGWHHRAGYVRDALLVLRDMRDSKIKEAQENYRGPKLKAIEDAANADYQTAREIAIDKVEKDLETVLASKRKAWDKANTPPTNEMLNLLRALEIRGNDLTRGEVASTVQALSASAPALRALRSICKRQGIEIPSFIGVDPDEFERQMEEAEQYARSHIDELDTPIDDLGYIGRLFWTRPGAGEDVRYFKELDSSVMTSADIRTITPTADKKKDTGESTKRTATGVTSGDKWSRLTWAGDVSIYSVAEQFGVSTADIQKANPSIDVKNLHAGDKINVPSTHLKSWSGMEGTVKMEDVEVIDRPTDTYPEGFGEIVDLTAAQE